MIAIVYREETRGALPLARQLQERLRQLGRAAMLVENSESGPGTLPVDTSIVLVLGGDGAMLGAVRLWAIHDLPDHVPVIGVNLGGLGFLTAFNPDELDLEEVISGNMPTSSRMLLEVEVLKSDNSRYRFIALNEAVVSKPISAHLLNLEVLADQAHLTNLRADGVIVATPTGSSAYNLSAGGPICHPDVECMLLTPVSSFNLSNRPLILPPYISVNVKMRDAGGILTCDGQVGTNLADDDVVTVCRATRKVRLGMTQDYFEILRRKLKWG